jgi:CRISP-associated protein Cas1
MRTMLLRANRQIPSDEITMAIQQMQQMMGLVAETRTVGALLGVEGNGSADYFRVFGKMVREPFHFTHRRRRPPTDPVNAMLSLGYTLLGHQVASAIHVVGLDPYTGFLHQFRHGRPSLALDMMEEFRPLTVDSIVLNICNHRLLMVNDFQEELGVVYLKPEARKKFYGKFEERLQEEIQHPRFEYHTSYRRCIELGITRIVESMRSLSITPVIGVVSSYRSVFWGNISWVRLHRTLHSLSGEQDGCKRESTFSERREYALRRQL